MFAAYAGESSRHRRDTVVLACCTAVFHPAPIAASVELDGSALQAGLDGSYIPFASRGWLCGDTFLLVEAAASPTLPSSVDADWLAEALLSRFSLTEIPLASRGTTIIELTMAPGDLGRVIGRQGRTAAAVRTLATAAGELDGERVSVDFRDD